MKPSSLCALALFAACGPAQPPLTATTRLDLNDVSYLYPLPAQLGEQETLLRFTSSGQKGALLERAVFDQVKPVDEVLPADQVYGGMRVISARVDPCFPTNKKGEPLSCKKQVRLVAQVLQLDVAQQVSTRDGTLHLFFDLSDADWQRVLSGVAELKALAQSATDGQPLGVHPVMKAEGHSGAYAQRLDALLLEVCGAENLSRVAFMQAGKDGASWAFGAFNRRGTTLEADLIPRFTDRKEQQVLEHGVETRRNSELVPTPKNIDLTTFLSATELSLADELTVQRAAREAYAIENPDLETPQTIDCASCHVVSRALTVAQAQRAFDPGALTERYLAPARFDVRRTDGAANNPFAQRAFGYFGAQSALSQRTINESAAIAEALSP